MFGELNDEKAMKAVLAADYVIVYGASLGESDLTWRMYISKWLSSSSSHRLLYFECDSDFDTNGTLMQIVIRQERYVRRRLLELPDLGEEYASQIDVAINSKIFQSKPGENL